MVTIDSYEKAQSVLLDIENRKADHLANFDKVTSGFGIYICAASYDKSLGTVIDALNDVFYELEKTASSIIEEYESHNNNRKEYGTYV